MRLRLGVIATIVGTVVLLAIVWVYAYSPMAQEGRSADATSRTDVVQQYDVGDREAVSDFSARLLDGGTIDEQDLRGRVTVVNVWGSWCGPCRAEAPELARVAKEHEGRVRFLGLNVRDSPDAARAFERRYEIPYPSVHPDDSPRTILAFGGALTAAAVPSTVVLDPDGAVAARVVGQVDAATLRGLVGDVLAEDDDAGPAAG